MRAEPLPKVVRALGAEATGSPDIAVPPLTPDSSVGDVARAAIARDAQRLVQHDAGTRLGDVEALHQMRVASRRLRGHLRSFAGQYEPTLATELAEDLRWLADALGAVRDLDVQQERLAESAGELLSVLWPLFGELEERQRAARDELLAALRSERYLHLLDTLVEAHRRPAVDEDESHSRPALVAEVAWAKLRRTARRLSEKRPADAFHLARIRAKRARYTAESVLDALPAMGAEAAVEYARRAAALQGILGEMQDAVVAVRELTEAGEKRSADGPLSLAIGRLIERELSRYEQAKASVPAAWQALDRKKLRRWMHA